MCEETKCDWKCKKPTLCPRPKCELVCEQPKCAYLPPVPTPVLNNTCCQCTQVNIAASMLQANEHATELGGETMSFIELTHHFKHQAQVGQAPCCACSK
jgi:hypothetical protein